MVAPSTSETLVPRPLRGPKILRVVLRTQSAAATGSHVPDGLGGRSVTPKTNREVVERYVNGMKARDLDIQAEVCAPDMIVEYPQSGERIRGWANVRAVLENYPSGLDVKVPSLHSVDVSLNDL